MKVRFIPLLVAACFMQVGSVLADDQAEALASFKKHIAKLEDPKIGERNVEAWARVKYDVWKTSSLVRPFAGSVEAYRMAGTFSKEKELVPDGPPRRFVGKLECLEGRWGLIELAVTNEKSPEEPETVVKDSPEWKIFTTALDLK